MNKTYVIIGTSAAGIGAAYRLRMLNAQCRIICISHEPDIPYNKCFIVEYLSGERELSQVLTLTSESAAEKNIACMLGVRVETIDTSNKLIITTTNQTLPYDALFIGTGCSPIMPGIEGIASKGVFSFYTIHDVHTIQAFIQEQHVRTAVVIGAGLAGLEAADGLRAHGIQVHVIERATHVLPYQIIPEAAHVIHEHMAVSDVTLHTNSTVTRIVSEKEYVDGVEFADGTQIKAEMVIYAVGVRPNSYLAKHAGITINNEYIVVDEHMKTNVPDVYAGGDVIVVKDRITGNAIPSCSWPDAMQQGMIAAYAMAGQQKRYDGVILATSSAFFGIKFAVCGPVKELLNRTDMRVEIKRGDGWYHCFVYDSCSILKGFILVGNTQDYMHLRRTLLMHHQ